MVFLLAKVLSCAFRSDLTGQMIMSGTTTTTSSSSSSWQQLDEEVEDWRRKLPPSFEPILFKPPSREQGRGLPEVWMLAPFHGE